jgi:hypothetical protein
VFENYKYMDNLYIDGGIGDMFPILHAEKQRDSNNILGIYIHSDISDITKGNYNILSYIHKLMFIPIRQNTLFKIGLFDKKNGDIIRLKPSMNVKSFDFTLSSKELLDMTSVGYRTAKRFWTCGKDGNGVDDK